MNSYSRLGRTKTSTLAAVLLAAFASVLSPGSSAGQECPAGYHRAGSEEIRRGPDETQRLFVAATSLCISDSHIESLEELQAMASQQAAIQNAPYASPPAGAFTAAQNHKRKLFKSGQDLENAHHWEQVGRGPLQAADPNYTGVNGLGHVELAGRITSFFYVPPSDRYWPDTLIASVSYGGVWITDASVGQWLSIADNLPTQAVGAVAYTPYKRGTIIALTGDGSFGADSREGGGAYFTRDGGRHWRRSIGIPDQAFGFRLAVDKARPHVVYAATGSGLYRSTDGGVHFTNVNLPTGACAGKSNRVRPCTLANMVTDVVVMAPGGATDEKGGVVMAAVGWRGGNRLNPDGTVQAPANGIYTSDTGNPGTFTKSAATGFAPQNRIGRIELGEVVGADQDHNIVYAMVQDAILRRNGLPGIDAPGSESIYAQCNTTKATLQETINSAELISPEDVEFALSAIPCKVPTVFNGLYVSRDWGQTWVQMADWSQVLLPTTGSALAGVATALGSGPGIQAWYNVFVRPDPTMTDPVTGAPTRLFFGLEEVWENANVGVPQIGPSLFRVIGRYFAGDTCMFLSLNALVRSYVPGAPNVPCVTNGTDALSTTTTTHPDQHDAILIPTSDGVQLIVGNDGGVYKQFAANGADFSNQYWGKGAQNGFNTLLPYDANMSEDGTVWMGLQDNGTAKIVDIVRKGRVVQRGRQIMTLGGDGFFTAVDPINSKVAYGEYTYGAMSSTIDGGFSWSGMDPPITNAQFSNPFVMDPKDPTHILTSGRQVVETISGAGTGADDWLKVFDLGTAGHRGDAEAAPTPTDPANQMTAVDLVGANAYVGFCGTCDVLDVAAPFKNGLATNVGGKLKPKKGTSNGWHFAKAIGLPNRYITGIAIDRANPKTVYATLGGYYRPWTPPGTLDRERVRGRHVYVSHDAGEHFTDISGNLPNTPVRWITLRGKQLILATDIGVFVSKAGAVCGKGCTYQVLGKGLPAAPVYTVRMAACDPNLLVAAAYGRGVYSYRFAPTEESTCAHPKKSALPKFLNNAVGSFDFELDEQGWVSTPTGALGWNRRPPGSNSSQAFTVTPYTNENTVSLTSPRMSVPARSLIKVQWDQQLNTEGGYDYLILDWSSDGKKWNTAYSDSGLNEGFPNFEPVTTQFVVPAGGLYIRFRLVSDQLVSSPPYTGAAVDNVVIKR